MQQEHKTLLKNTCAIIVSFQPDYDRLNALIKKIAQELQQIIIISNGATDKQKLVQTENCQTLFMQNESNKGLSKALNQGVTQANQLGFQYCILFDQDSLPQDNMIEILWQNYQQLKSQHNIAAIGPSIYDEFLQSHLPFIQFGWLSNKKIIAKQHKQNLACDFIITSGMLFEINTYHQLNGFDENIFLDNVDIDWCCRAKKMGMDIFGSQHAELHHQIGNQVDTSPWLLGKHVRLHNPARLKSIMQSRVQMYKKASTPLKWKVRDFFRAWAKFFYHAIMGPQRWASIKYMVQGFCQGLKQ